MAILSSVSLKGCQTMVEESAQLIKSYQYCRNSAKVNSNFYWGMMLTKSSAKRNAIFSIYAWLRAIDDIADDETRSHAARFDRLENFLNHTLTMLQNPISDAEDFWPAFRQTILAYHIPIDYLEEMVTGQKQDLVKDNYRNFNELYQYCHYVASMVGLMCVNIWGLVEGVDKNKAKEYAESAGVALQLTNILRDMQADAILKRVYLPAEFVHREKVSAKDFNQIPHEDLVKGIVKLIEKTAPYYQRSEALFDCLHDDGKLSFYVMINSYKVIFDKIRLNPEWVLSAKKINLSKFEKIKIVLNAFRKRYLEP